MHLMPKVTSAIIAVAKFKKKRPNMQRFCQFLFGGRRRRTKSMTEARRKKKEMKTTIHDMYSLMRDSK